MRVVYWLMCGSLLMLLLGAITVKSEERAPRPVAIEEWTEEAKVWTARSCVGEAGFDAVAECAAIAWVYATRANAGNKAYLEIVRQYSGAIKRHSSHCRPWIFGLNLEGTKPKGWPRNMLWSKHNVLWRKLLVSLDEWAQGYVANPALGANHYSSRFEARVAYANGWTVVDTPEYFKNVFLNSRGRK